MLPLVAAPMPARRTTWSARGLSDRLGAVELHRRHELDPRDGRAVLDACGTGERRDGCYAYGDEERDVHGSGWSVGRRRDSRGLDGLDEENLAPLPDGSYEVARSRSTTRGRTCGVRRVPWTHTGDGEPMPLDRPEGRDRLRLRMDFEGVRISHVTKIWNPGPRPGAGDRGVASGIQIAASTSPHSSAEDFPVGILARDRGEPARDGRQAGARQAAPASVGTRGSFPGVAYRQQPRKPRPGSARLR